MELFRERGYDETTVDAIAERAGLTERTFFRYFADKREVLFWGSATFVKVIVDAVEAAPADMPPLAAVGAALEAAGAGIEENRGRRYARARHHIIAAHTELREREQMKLMSMASAVAAVLRVRGVGEPAASLAAEIGVAAFKVGFARWVDDTRSGPIMEHIRAALDELDTVVAGRRRKRAAGELDTATGRRRKRATR
jgi:AcrR family transcriptional regulator